MKRMMGLTFLFVSLTLASAADLEAWQRGWEAHDLAVEAAHVEESEPGRDTWRCVARDNGHEDHAGGHDAFGHDYEYVRWDAFASCKQFHADCAVTCFRE